jgi:hypothetical protein
MNAVIRRKHEVLVVANETVEAHIASLRTGQAELKADLRELRADNKSLRDRIEAIHITLRAKIDAVHATLLGRLDATNNKVDNVHTTLRDKMDRNHAELNDKLGKLTEAVASMRGLQIATIWVLGGVGTVATIVTAVGKALRWF